jgi:hypothetical protein
MDQQFITKTTLENAGFDLTGEDIPALLEHLNETLQERISAEITESLSDIQVETLISLQESATEEQLATWLETNVPNMDEIVQAEMDILLSEIAEDDVQ